MISLEVLGAFDFLENEVKIGNLDYDRIKGSASYRFSYDEKFLRDFSFLNMSADLGIFPGVQSAAGRIFTFLGDALPDRWGRSLIDKREKILAKEQGRLARTFDDFGYLIRIDDATRMGALRFKYDGSYVGMSPDGMNIPPLSKLGTFIREAALFEKEEKDGQQVNERWIDNLWRQGSSLGGARPKANIVKEDGSIWIAKIPSIRDTYDIALWENFACKMARRVGITVAETELIASDTSPYHTLLSRRFDRNAYGRIHYSSSLTLTGLHDGDGSDTGKGYVDIANAIVGEMGCVATNDNLEELFRRVVFNIIIGNHDDHFRNHGFLLTKKGWTLSPAFDLNPTLMQNQSLMISPYTNRSSLADLLDASEYYLLERSVAKDIIGEVCERFVKWKEFAAFCGISSKELERFSPRIEAGLKDGCSLFVNISPVRIETSGKAMGLNINTKRKI